MESIRLIYFRGCPVAVRAKDLLLQMGFSNIQEILQDDYPLNHYYKSFVSPSILAGDKIIYGERTHGAGACSVTPLSREHLETALNQFSSRS